uniref:Regulation of nuclear pre-mRNA domain-containing protein 2 n=1 Tax=Ciona savignyi TaxID=51511 RepID=H2YRQ5_CIOSA
MAKQMNPENVIKKLKSVSNTQDSIPMLSLWIIHHKAHHKLIVDLWLKVLKNSKASHRLTLLYLCNDVIQNCRRKNAAMYKDAYMDTLPEAVSHLREESIRPNVQRVMKIWAKRGVFDTEYTDQLLAALLTNRAPEKLRNKLLVEYKTTGLISEITQFKQLEDKIEVDEKRLRTTRVDVSSTEAIKKLKDKVGGEKFSREFEESATQLDDFISQFEKYVERRKHLLDVLEKGT